MTRVFFIAEAGVNHNGSIQRAIDLVAAAAAAGADAVKFQTFKADAVAAASARKAAYQARETGAEQSQLEMLRALELSDDEFRQVQAACGAAGIEFMSTPFDFPSLEFLSHDLKVKRLKCPSGEITNGPFILAMAQTGLPVILSTGMATMEEINDALAVLAYGYCHKGPPAGLKQLRAHLATPAAEAALRAHVTVLHCTSAYPAPFSDLNLLAMRSITDRFKLPVGYSDHSAGLHISIAAVALGATCIEKHFTLDRNLPGPDHKASLEPSELAALIRQVRETTLALGHQEKGPTGSELDTMAVARRSLVATAPIKAGSRFAAAKLAALRPAGGASPMAMWDLLHTDSSRDYETGDMIAPVIAPAR
jgi:N-acetylneuraminate synthase